MNLPSLVLLLAILSVAAYAVFKTIRAKGACEDCTTNTCPVKGVSVAGPAISKHDCCE